MTPDQFTQILAAITGATQMQIGFPVLGGTAQRSLFVGPGPVLAQSTAVTLTPGVVELQILVGAAYVQLLGPAGTLYCTDGTRSATLGSATGAGLFQDGVRTVSICDGTNHVSYTPAAAADWNGADPTDVWTALDRCAALLKTLNGGVGP
jgi:hypothetical protein